MEQAIAKGDFDLLVDLPDRGAQTLMREMDFDQVTDLMPDLGLLARTEGIDGFAALPAALED
ncbi:MAG: hypothetical protein ACJ0UT_11065 [Candidatus Latescibacterota bacterium]